MVSTLQKMQVTLFVRNSNKDQAHEVKCLIFFYRSKNSYFLEGDVT